MRSKLDSSFSISRLMRTASAYGEARDRRAGHTLMRRLADMHRLPAWRHSDDDARLRAHRAPRHPDGALAPAADLVHGVVPAPLRADVRHPLRRLHVAD